MPMSVKRRSLATQSTGVSPIASASEAPVSIVAFDLVASTTRSTSLTTFSLLSPFTPISSARSFARCASREPM